MNELDAFARYVDGLSLLLANGQPSSARVRAILDGEVSRELRHKVTLEARRQMGAFFTPRAHAEKLVSKEAPFLTSNSVVVDPSMGAGDLLLAAARRLPVKKSLSKTLSYWGGRLMGRDVRPEFVRAGRVRLALLAAKRLSLAMSLDEAAVSELLPLIEVGKAEDLEFERKSLILLNPPYGSEPAPPAIDWAGGRVNRASLSVDRCVLQAEAGARLAAILPDVLRSGSRYAKWRAFIESSIHIEAVTTLGQFDPSTDVDVFVLRGRVLNSAPTIATRPAEVSAIWWGVPLENGTTLSNFFDVRVGPVVPHRDPLKGKSLPFIRARDLPLKGRYVAGSIRRRFAGPTFLPPFVVVRRTCRPDGQGTRVIANLIIGFEPVAVENHLIVCLPKDKTIQACQALLQLLRDDRSRRWLAKRIRCRHLTVGALGHLPWRKSKKRNATS